MSRFNDETPIRITFATTRGALAALKDHPARLSPVSEGSYFVNAVHRALDDLGKAEELPVGSEVRLPDARDERREAAVKMMKRHARAARPEADYEPDIEYLDEALLRFAEEWARANEQTAVGGKRPKCG